MIQALKSRKGMAYAVSFAVLLAMFVAVLAYADKEQAVKQVKAPPGRIYDAGVFGENVVVHDSTGGEIIIAAAHEDNTAEIIPLAAAPKIISDPDDIWKEDTYAGNHTFVEAVRMQNGSIGVLTIPKIELSVNVYESPDNMEAMSKGVSHFPDTSTWDGNVSISAHNTNFDGSDGYFKYLYTLEKGDIIIYVTTLGERIYTVAGITAIAASDWSPLYYTDENKLTMITCISGQPDKRLCVQALERASS